MLTENSPLALYYQLKNIFVENIRSRRWEVHTKIPTERELCEIYGVSRITVRQALKELENEGMLYRKQGKGTFVTIPKFNQRLSRFYSFSEEITRMGSVPQTRVLSFGRAVAGSAAAKLGISPGDAVFAIRRLRMANDDPFAVETSYIACAAAGGLTEEMVAHLGLYNALYRVAGVTPDEATETFEAVLISAQDAQLLQVARKSAGLHVERVASAAGKPLEFCDSVIRGDKYKYTVSLEK